MRYQVDQMKILVSSKKTLEENISKYYHIENFTYKIISKSIDARKKSEIYYVYRLMIDTEEELSGKLITPYVEKTTTMNYPKWQEDKAPIIVGFGPAGMFAALYLARCGAKPIIIERGACIEERQKAVQEFLQNKILNPNCNVQFGEGGAGTFSDGKLTTNLKNPMIMFILQELVNHGAKEEILYEAMPHVGTDYLAKIVKSMREEIKSLGGTFYFNTIFLDAQKQADDTFVVTAQKDERLSFQTNHLLLGLGHSARDTIRHLYDDMHLAMEPKSFSMGVRIEHPAKMINEAQYGRLAGCLPPAYYKLAHHTKERGIYTFCMCPGGYVLASQSEEGTIVTNGMSNQNRAGENSNGAILVDVKPSDYMKDHPLDGLAYQEYYEKLAFKIGKDYRAPANLVAEFMKNQVAEGLRSIPTTYPHGLVFTNLKYCLPKFVVNGIKEGIIAFDQKLRGFAHPDAVLVGIESRSSSPVRIMRDETRQSSVPGIYPIGEGAGYAGGISSAALDGLLTAMKIGGNGND